MNQDQLTEGLAEYIQHLESITATFNEWAAHRGLPIQMDPASAITAVRAGIGLARIAPFWSRTDDTGIIHDSQLKTAIDCFVQLSGDPRRCGHILGAMQSGKTTTSLALQWAGPVLYLLTGSRAYPFYLISNQTNHEDQTKTELDRFLAYYGNVEIKRTASATTAMPDGLDAVFLHSSSLANYREHVLRDLEDVFAVPQLEDIVHRRVGGNQAIQRVAELCRKAADQGYRALMIIDEPQFGASDRMVEGDDGPVRRPCVLMQIFDRIEQEIGTSRDDHWFVGLSATPFELNDLRRVWEVRQCLTATYSGFNFFNGRPISEGVDIVPPTTMGLTQFAEWIEVPFIAHVLLSAYDGPDSTFRRHTRKIAFQGDQAAYQGAVETALRESIYRLLDRYGPESSEPVGLCIRAFNDNARTEALIGRLALDTNRIEVLRYYGGRASGFSVKRIIARRERPELPYIVFVTNRARMADAFPVQVRFFMDFAQKANDLNALLQGLLGRACGYGKRSTVVLSDANAGIIDAYVATSGGYVHRTSRHSVAIGGFRRGAPTGMLKLRVEMDDPIVQRFFEKINNQAVAPNIPDGATKASPPRGSRVSSGGNRFRTGPILRIAESLGLFNHIEQPEVRARLFPQIPTGFHVARANDAVRHARQSGVILRYHLDTEGNCRYTFRWSERDAAAQGGAQGRAKGQRDSGQHMEPTIYVEKFDPETGEIIYDRDPSNGAEQRPGNWRAFMVTFPLREPVREVLAAEVAYPVELSPYDNWMEPEEREARDLEQAAS